MAGDRKPRVAIIGTGGSISIEGRNSLDLFEYGDFGRVLEVEELVRLVPEASIFAEVVPVPFRAVRSLAIGPVEWLELSEFVDSVAQTTDGLEGIVVTHGTSVLEETAYFLNLTLKTSLPVVLVGSQRPPTGLSTDAPLNIVSAVRVAASPSCRGLGVLVVLNDEIHAARDVTKRSTFRLHTFRSEDVGMLGYADPDGSVAIYRAPTRRHAPGTIFDMRGLKELPRVDISYSYGGSDGAVIRALIEVGARGIVTAGLVPGVVTPGERTALSEARRRGILVVHSNRGGSGRVLSRVHLRDEGIVVADNLNPQKARVLAMLALTISDDPTQVQAIFDEY